MILFLCLGAIAMEGQTASFSDPGRPGTVRIRQSNGSITVRGYNGKDVVIESQPAHKEQPQLAVRVSEEGNRMTISAPANSGLTIQVPLQTSLQLNATNGSILVERVLGELDVQSTNGSIVLRGVASAVVAHSQNGSMTVTFDRVNPRKPMSFSSMNGKIDVTFPADLKATIKARAERGQVHSDFDLTMSGGGPEIQFKNYNGVIYVRKAGK